ncbi:glycosyltransferase family 2 protein [Candidatus Daviesbacteria bacterium]|nr:glycosyltransferase family 2 protein [Candidatus Daviesbacteria bacterium]
MIKLSLALATFNEEDNIGNCLKSVEDLVDEIVIVDGGSTDKTVEIAKNYGARVYITDNPPIFHINKQKALDLTAGSWILQLDADERVSSKLAVEIKKVISMTDQEIQKYQDSLPNKRLFVAHQKLIDLRDGKIGNDADEYTAFFIPRLNFFLGKFLRFGGVYPDGVIRLFKKNRAYLPCKDVHEQYVVDGRVGWLQNDLLHMADPTFSRYIKRNNRYINLIVGELKRDKLQKNIPQFVNYCFVKPLWWFFWTQVRHKGALDGIQGVIFSFFSALRFPRAYIKYLTK